MGLAPERKRVSQHGAQERGDETGHTHQQYQQLTTEVKDQHGKLQFVRERERERGGGGKRKGMRERERETERERARERERGREREREI